MTKKIKMYQSPKYSFKPDTLYSETAYWTRFVPFVFRPDFIRSLLKVLNEGKMEMDVPCWSSTPPLVHSGYYDLELHTNPRTGVRSALFPVINKAHALQYVPNEAGILYGTLRNYQKFTRLEKQHQAHTTITNYHRDLVAWHGRVRKTKITLNMNDVFALMYFVYVNYARIENQRISIRVQDMNAFGDYCYTSRDNAARHKLKRRFPKPETPSWTSNFSTDDLKHFISACFKRKYKKDLSLYLGSKFGITFELFNYAGGDSLFYDSRFIIFRGARVPESIVDNGDGTRYLFKCTCCDNVVSGTRSIYSVKHTNLFKFYSKIEYEERCKQRQNNPAKYSSNSVYREPPSATSPQKNLSPFKPHVDKFGAVNGYVRDVTKALNDHFALLDKLSQQKGANQRLPVGGYQQSSHIDNLEIDHQEWERKEYPLSHKDLVSLTFLPSNGDPIIFVCTLCDNWITYWMHRFHVQRVKDTGNLTANVWTRDGGAGGITVNTARGGGDGGTTALDYTWVTAGSTMVPAREVKDTNKRVLPRNSSQGFIIQEHRASPLDHCEKGFLLAYGENKKIQKIPVYDTKGVLKGIRDLDRTLYMGVELEVTPSQKATEFIEGATEIPLKSEHQSGYYYNETKFVASMVANKFFNSNPMAIVKHDGSTANGFEIVSVPGTHKWHTEQGWIGFFHEDYEDPLFKELAPSAWLCGWVNNGGRSNNPIYKYQTGEGKRPVCGIHIHVSRDAISPLTLGKLLHFTTNPQSLKFIEDVAGRNEKRYAKIIPQKVKDGKILHTINSGTGRSNDYLAPERKYEALNIHTGKPTIEFRMFRSNVSKAGFMKNIDFVHALVTWCQQEASMNFEKLNVDNFIAWCNTQRGVYKYLTQWLVQKKYLSTIHQFNPKYHNPIVFEDVVVNEEKVA